MAGGDHLGPGELVAGGDDLGAKKGGGAIDDLVSQMPIESYIDCRGRPITDALEFRAPKMAKRHQGLESVAILANTAGAILAVLGETDWIAVTVAVASVAMAFMDYFYIPSQLAATNQAVQDCHNLLIWWDSLSLVQRKQRTTKAKCVATIEGAVLNLCAARTALSKALPSEQVEAEEEEEKK